MPITGVNCITKRREYILNDYYFIIGIILILDFVAILVVINEEVMYSPLEKVWKIVLILVIPLIGAILQLDFLGKLHSPYKKNEQNGNNPQAYDDSEHYSDFSGGGDGGGSD